MKFVNQVKGWVEKNKDQIAEAISQLVQIKTENLPPGGNEKPGQEYLYDFASTFLDESDLDMFEIDEVKTLRDSPLFFGTMAGMEKQYQGRPNLVARLKGANHRRSLLFSGHIDTMPATGPWKVFEDPFSGKIKDGKLYGRGSADMKAGTLAGFFALKCIKELGLKLAGDLYAESVIDEENGGVNGTIASRLRYPDIDFAILAEVTNLAAGIETIGGSDWVAQIKEKGPGGIGTDIELPNPIYKLARVAQALEKYDREVLAQEKPPAAYGPEMKLRLLTYQFASGGSIYLESGSVPTEGHIYFWLETYAHNLEKEARKKFMDFMASQLKDIEGTKPEFKTVIRFMGGHRTDTGHPAMGSIRSAYRALGLKLEEKGLPLAMDAYAFKATSNTDVVVIGPQGTNPHGVDEYVELESVYKLINIMVLAAIDYCG
ncbi:MAG: M20/M25/M40 family metallo-hydrolase [Actinomycetota bacterium]|jgi:acetylornithine deacetylase|nr:M20/M25/M40 family metallo-hydrolase [Actinomycetota bacterium]